MEIEEKKTEMEVGDCSLWHYLIFCEEFISDAYENNFVCRVCKDPVLGHPTFKCLECGFVQHESCSKLADLIKMDVEHDITKRHHLLLREEMVNDVKEGAICLRCKKRVSGPTYRCSIPQCTFHFHKSCNQLSHAIQHVVHPDHTLLLRLSSPTVSCDLCKRYGKDLLLYSCGMCSFEVDMECLHHWDIWRKREMEAEDCSLWHYLIFCEEFVSDNYKNDAVCWVCKEPVSGHPAFKCLECGFVQHKSCSQLPNLTEMDIEHDIRKRHHLILREEIENSGEEEVVCSGCGKLVSGPTYKCSVLQCTFHLHKSCDQLSHAIQHIRHPDHTLLLGLPASYISCDLCKKKRKKHPLLYGCRICNFDVDIKCLPRWDIIESEIKMEAEDCSMWHYLIFCEEFMSNNYENDVDCWICEKSVSRHPTFKCLECSFIQHKACIQPPDLTKMDLHDYFRGRHHMILKEETENNAKEGEVCVGCREVVSGPTYRCSIPECPFHLHESCHQLSRAIQNIAHPKHTLFLELPTFDTHCGICGKDRHKGTTLLYTCGLCKFEIDYKCTSSVKVIENDDCDPHVLILCRKSIPFTCEACGVEVEDVASQCSNCGVLTHPMCAYFPQTIKIKSHPPHLLSRTYCLHRVTKLEEGICKLCCKKVNTKCGAYYCKLCDYIVHMRCAKLNQDESIICSEEDYRRHLVYLIEGLDDEEDKADNVPLKINHKNHPQHELILRFEDFENDKQLYKNDKRCAVCMQFIICSSFYSCEDCNNIFLHKRCAQLPNAVRRPLFDDNSFMLSSHLLSSIDDLFRCYQCGVYRHGLFYNSGYIEIDVQCFLIPETISHKSHEHLLYVPTLDDPKLQANCIGCGKKIYEWRRYVMCSDCKFWLCFKCATLPLVARYRYHPHLLKLTYTYKDDSEECYCLICEEKLDPKCWFYFCEDCDFSTHIQCIIGSSLKIGRHEHPVILVQAHKDSPKCHLCERSFRYYEHVLECPQCKFNFHFKCYYARYF